MKNMEAAYLDIFVIKAMRVLSERELDKDDKWLSTLVRAIKALLKVRKPS